jgi:hypothetical protein
MRAPRVSRSSRQRLSRYRAPERRLNDGSIFRASRSRKCLGLAVVRVEDDRQIESKPAIDVLDA